MSPLNRGSPLGSRILPAGARPLPPPRFGGGRPGMMQRIPPLPPRMPSPPQMRRMPPMSPMFGPGDPRQRISSLPPSPLPPPRSGGGGGVGGGGMSRINGVPPLFPGGPRARGHLAPIVPGPMGPRGPLMRPWPRRMPPQMMPPMRPMRYNTGNGNLKGKPIRNAKKINNRPGGQKTRDNNSTIESEGVQKTVNSTEQSEQTDHMEEKQPSSEQAQP